MLPYCTANGSLSLTPGGVDGGIDGQEKFARNIGIMYLVLGFTAIPISGFVLSVFIRRPLINHSCYKIMALTTVLDICNLVNGAIIPGFFSVLNIHHCNAPWSLYVVWPANYFWIGYCCTSEVLALNRMLQFANKNVASFLFDGKRIYFWFGVVVAYAIIGEQLTPDKFYFYNPYGGYIAINRLNGEPHIILIFNNLFKFGFITVSYGAMLVFIYRMLKKNDIARASKFQIKISIQTLTIAVLADITTVAYLAISYAPLPSEIAPYAGVFGETSWIFLHAGTAVIYLIMNNSVKQRMEEVFGCGKIAPSQFTVEVTSTLNGPPLG
ncbi:hypothetical protein QR680_006814 [Steinernema hermaphroditum]|uniref:Uncharacterized protein n=1 Tax=Steinernema hermaphroditum TaxID=289476 RepID=A0AA39LXZ8_9BILA|nr:hypothetical protein QR680_006814 [Steinernema hermaphroditum]